MIEPENSSRGLTILVCVKFTVDVNQLQADPATGQPNLARAVYRISNFDENAIEEAVRLKEKHGGRVIGISLAEQSPPRDVALKALAMGVDSLFVVKDARAARGGPGVAATVLAALVEKLVASHDISGWDLILCGDGSADEYNGQVGIRIAEALGVPSVTYVTRLEVAGGSLRADRAGERATETVEASLPAVVTVGMETNQPRMPTVLQIMGGGRKPIVELSLAELDRPDLLDLAAGQVVETEDIYAPPSARKRLVLKGEAVEETVQLLLRHLGEAGEVRF